MGMSMSVLGFKPPDAKWKAMKAIFDACESAGVAVPKEVDEFFGYDAPDDKGVDIDAEELRKCGALSEYQDDAQEGFEIDIKKLPKDVTTLRFYCSW